MDKFSTKDLHKGLVARGFSGSVDDLDGLVREAQNAKRERDALVEWKDVDGAPAFLRRAFGHARKHKRPLSAQTVPQGRVLFLDRDDRRGALRLARIDMMSEGAILGFFRGERFVGHRGMRWDGVPVSRAPFQVAGG